MSSHPTKDSVRTSLTERYVQAALRSVPGQTRSDIEPELRSSIADAVDARVAAGEDASAAEVAVLTDLGDPARLAASYSGEPLHLIGPALFLDYVRLLRTLVVIVLPITAVAVTVVQFARGESIGQAIGTVVSTTLTTGLHLAFWTTLGFAVLERVPGVRTPLTGPWNPSMLPPPRDEAAGRSFAARTGQVIALVVGTAVFITAILLAPSLSPKQDAAGNPINILNPELWDSGLVYVYIGLSVLSLVVVVAGLYSARFAVAGALAGIPASVLLLWLAWGDRVLNPAFVEAVGWSPDVTKWIRIGLIVAALLGIVTPFFEAIKAARRR